MLIIWLQGIWLPLHGYNYSDTPFWAGIFLLPLTAGILISGPVSGFLSDRFGARGFATADMVVFAVGDVRCGSVKRVASAVGEGSVAIRLIHDYLRGD
jgi:MFS family permease